MLTRSTMWSLMRLSPVASVLDAPQVRATGSQALPCSISHSGSSGKPLVPRAHLGRSWTTGPNRQRSQRLTVTQGQEDIKVMGVMGVDSRTMTGQALTAPGQEAAVVLGGPSPVHPHPSSQTCGTTAGSRPLARCLLLVGLRRRMLTKILRAS